MTTNDDTGRFASAWWKWHWAGLHLSKLKACFPANGPAPFAGADVRSEYDARRHCVVLRLVQVAPYPPEWSLYLGDVVANFRGALDHLAWAVVQRGSLADQLGKRERQVYFPITPSEAEFRNEIKTKLPGAAKKDIAIIRRSQPYMRGKRQVPRDILTVLNLCSNQDKHRALQPTTVLPEHSVLNVQEARDCTITRTGMSLVRTDVLRPGGEIGRIYVRKTGPNPQVITSGRFGLDVAIGDKVWLRPWLNSTQQVIGDLLAEFSPPPAGIIHIPPDERTALGFS